MGSCQAVAELQYIYMVTTYTTYLAYVFDFIYLLHAITLVFAAQYVSKWIAKEKVANPYFTLHFSKYIPI